MYLGFFYFNLRYFILIIRLSVETNAYFLLYYRAIFCDYLRWSLYV